MTKEQKAQLLIELIDVLKKNLHHLQIISALIQSQEKRWGRIEELIKTFKIDPPGKAEKGV